MCVLRCAKVPDESTAAACSVLRCAKVQHVVWSVVLRCLTLNWLSAACSVLRCLTLNWLEVEQRLCKNQGALLWLNLTVRVCMPRNTTKQGGASYESAPFQVKNATAGVSTGSARHTRSAVFQHAEANITPPAPKYCMLVPHIHLQCTENAGSKLLVQNLSSGAGAGTRTCTRMVHGSLFGAHTCACGRCCISSTRAAQYYTPLSSSWRGSQPRFHAATLCLPCNPSRMNTPCTTRNTHANTHARTHAHTRL